MGRKPKVESDFDDDLVLAPFMYEEIIIEPVRGYGISYIPLNWVLFKKARTKYFFAGYHSSLENAIRSMEQHITEDEVLKAARRKGEALKLDELPDLFKKIESYIRKIKVKE